ncbi:MAG: hypothetical protein J2P16_09395, partial [Mycobacterium sp.]|nr:hypothetical protein [Mycobacterium sp.]
RSYLTTAGQAIDIGQDAGSVIAGWAPDETYWLTDMLEITGPASHWTRDDRSEDTWRTVHEQG